MTDYFEFVIFMSFVVNTSSSGRMGGAERVDD